MTTIFHAVGRFDSAEARCNVFQSQRPSDSQASHCTNLSAKASWKVRDLMADGNAAALREISRETQSVSLACDCAGSNPAALINLPAPVLAEPRSMTPRLETSGNPDSQWSSWMWNGEARESTRPISNAVWTLAAGNSILPEKQVRLLSSPQSHGRASKALQAETWPDSWWLWNTPAITLSAWRFKSAQKYQHPRLCEITSGKRKAAALTNF